MLPNDDLARWGEPPTDEPELALAELLAEVLQRDAGPVPEATRQRAERTADAARLLEVCRWIDEMMHSVIDRSGVLENLPPPADAGGAGTTVELRLSVSRLVASAWQPVASTHRRPCVVRDMRRVPDNPDRVTLRTGDRVRVEAVADRDGWLLVFNVGPRGTVNVLYPQGDAEGIALREGEPVSLPDVEMMPPAGRERLYAVWSRRPLTAPGTRVRDMRRVEEVLAQQRPDDWHAVVLELEHQS